MQDRTSRRDFWKPRRTVPVQEEITLLRAGRPAMGTRFEILFPAAKRLLITAVHDALDEIRRLERVMTVFSEDSQISEVNNSGACFPVRVDRDLFGLLEHCLELHRATNGAFDAASGSLWRCWGFHRRKGEVPNESALQKALSESGSRFVELNAADLTVSLKKSGVALNLGSIGKGFALDRAAELLQNAGLGQALLHAGHSSFYALGDAAGQQQGWKVSIRHPVDHEASFAVLRLRNQGMGTSGIGEQFFEVDGRRYGHIIDPRTGQPVTHNLSATVVAPNAALADALATAFFTMTADEVGDYCERNPQIGALLVPSPLEGEPLRRIELGTVSSCME